MPVRNEAFLLSACLEDVLSQTHSDIELVVVDDGSTDTTDELLKEASKRDPRIRVINTKPEGIISALNTGLAECNGQYIARMDADDRMDKTRLEKQLKLMKRDPELDLIGCRIEGFTDSGKITDSVKKYHSWRNYLDFKMSTISPNFYSRVWDLRFYCLLNLIFNCHCPFSLLTNPPLFLHPTGFSFFLFGRFEHKRSFTTAGTLCRGIVEFKSTIH